MKPSIKQRWTPLRRSDSDAVSSRQEYCFRNATHTVFKSPMNCDSGLADPFDGWVCLSIKRNDREAECDWRIWMRIKNELVGPDREAIQVFPALSRVVDTANQFFLWVAPKGYVLGVGFIDRLVMDEQLSTQANAALGYPGAPKQRPFDEDCPLGVMVGLDPLPETKKEGVFPLPLYPETALHLMRSAYQTAHPKENSDES